MNTRQIEAFRAIARTGTVTGAAATLHISQPAVSRLLAHLEQKLGMLLFARNAGRLQLTPEGEALLTEVEQHFVGLDAVAQAAKRIALHGPGQLRVVGFPSLTSGPLPRAIARLLSAHPATSVTLDTDTTDRIARLVAAGRYDVGFAAGPVTPEPSLEVQSLAMRAWMFVCARGHPLAQGGPIDIVTVAEQPLVGFSPTMSLRARTDELFAAHGLAPDVVCQAQTIESICALVGAGCGAAVIHPFARHVAELHGLHWRTLADVPSLELTAITQPAPRRARMAAQFNALVVEAISD